MQLTTEEKRIVRLIRLVESVPAALEKADRSVDRAAIGNAKSLDRFDKVLDIIENDMNPNTLANMSDEHQMVLNAFRMARVAYTEDGLGKEMKVLDVLHKKKRKQDTEDTKPSKKKHKAEPKKVKWADDEADDGDKDVEDDEAKDISFVAPEEDDG